MNKTKYKILKKLDTSNESLRSYILINALKKSDKDVLILQKHLDDLMAQDLVRYRDNPHQSDTPLVVTPNGRDYIDRYYEARLSSMRSYMALFCAFVSVAISFFALILS